MGYFADIIKDSRISLSVCGGPAAPSHSLAGQPTPADTAGSISIPGSRRRNFVAGRSPDTTDTKLVPKTAARIESHAMPAEMVNACRAIKKSKDPRPLPPPVDDQVGPGGSMKSNEAHPAKPVIQRKALTTRVSAAAGPKMSRARRSDLPPQRPVSVDPSAVNPERSSLQPPSDGAPQPAQERPISTALAAGDRRQAMPGPSAQPIKPEVAAIEPVAPPIEPRTTLIAESYRTSIGQPDQVAEDARPIEATVKGTATKPPLPGSSKESARQVGNIRIAVAGHSDTPRVQIGQVNVIVEESRVPPKSTPGEQRGDNLASRTFLRSL